MNFEYQRKHFNLIKAVERLDRERRDSVIFETKNWTPILLSGSYRSLDIHSGLEVKNPRLAVYSKNLKTGYIQFILELDCIKTESFEGEHTKVDAYIYKKELAEKLGNTHE